MSDVNKRDFTHDFFLPTLLFSALGAMAWAVRGCAGAGGMNAHVAPGLIWGTAWWFMARDRGGLQTRRYTSGWILLAVTTGFAIAGERGWMQWHHFYDGHLSTNYATKSYVPISRAYGFLWYFIAGSAWAGLPACFLAWCGSQRRMQAWEWTLRIACGFGGAYLTWRLFTAFPQMFLPLYDTLQDKYHDFHANPSLIKLYRDCGASTRHVGFCLGFLLYEVVRRDWKSAKLIFIVSLVNGAGWAALQNWKWATQVWPGASFNFGRCWEASGGVSIGIGFGLAYYLVNRRMSPDEIAAEDLRLRGASPLRQWFLASGLLCVIGWTMFWSPSIDLRQANAPIPPLWLLHICGFVCLAFAAALAAAALRYSARSRRDSGTDDANNRARLEWWVEMGTLLVLGWFVRTQLVNRYSDEPADGAMGVWFGPASIYYAILVVYAAARCLKRFSVRRTDAAVEALDSAYATYGYGMNADGLAVYSSLGVILLWCISVGMENAWHASIAFGVVGAAFGIGYCYFTNRETSPPANPTPFFEDPNLERWGAFLGLLYGLGLTVRKAIKGGTNLYGGNENYWDRIAWNWVALVMLLCMLGGTIWMLRRRKAADFRDDVFPNAYGILWLMLIAENILAQVVTGPMFGSAASWIEFVFNVLYILLFFITAVIVLHVQYVKCEASNNLSAHVDRIDRNRVLS